MTTSKVKELLEKGVLKSEIAKELGFSKSTISYHARKLGKVKPSNRYICWKK